MEMVERSGDMHLRNMGKLLFIFATLFSLVYD